jgi:hypothetical protein
VTTPTRAGRDLARAALGTAGLVLGSLLACALFLEVALRIAPELLGSRTANQIFSVYHAKPGGIYFHEPVTDLLYMRPDYQTHAWFNGYTWHHATDARGFRNPPGRPVDGALLLGDSLIYGHGVEEEDGVAAQLEKRHGRRVYNLSRQGDSLYPHYVMLRLHLEAFRPETVVLFVFHNDFHDLLAYRGVALLQEAPEITFGDYARIREQLADRPAEALTQGRDDLGQRHQLRIGYKKRFARTVLVPQHVHDRIDQIVESEQRAPVGKSCQR